MVDRETVTTVPEVGESNTASKPNLEKEMVKKDGVGAFAMGCLVGALVTVLRETTENCSQVNDE